MITREDVQRVAVEVGLLREADQTHFGDMVELFATRIAALAVERSKINADPQERSSQGSVTTTEASPAVSAPDINYIGTETTLAKARRSVTRNAAPQEAQAERVDINQAMSGSPTDNPAVSAPDVEPVAWMHECETRPDVISTRIKAIWLAANPKFVKHYTIPLVLQSSVAALIEKARREEREACAEIRTPLHLGDGDCENKEKRRAEGGES